MNAITRPVHKTETSVLCKYYDRVSFSNFECYYLNQIYFVFVEFQCQFDVYSVTSQRKLIFADRITFRGFILLPISSEEFLEIIPAPDFIFQRISA
jgi:hypothetical protein